MSNGHNEGQSELSSKSSNMAARATPNAMPSREQILAASAGWVAVLLNVIPGLGAGYLYQRRWKAYWITSALATAWFVAGAVLGKTLTPPLKRKTNWWASSACCYWQEAPPPKPVWP